jgi:ubiquinone/menaquinone biosynthesis C-methylase UbiE
VQHRDHVELIRAGVQAGGYRWLELGAGEGAFTLALSELLGADGRIVAVDRDRAALRTLETRAAEYPATVEVHVGDFTIDLPDGPFDAVLAANSLHFVSDRTLTLDLVRRRLRPRGRLLIVEYDADRGNPWVPHPFSFRTWRREAVAAGFAEPRLIGRAPSRFLGAFYAAVAERDVSRSTPQ